LRAHGGIRTRDTVVTIEVTDLFTTELAFVLLGNSRERAKPRDRRVLLLEHATRQPSRGRLHATMHAPVGFEPTLSRAKYPPSSPPTKMYPGEQTTRAQGRFTVEVSRVFTTWNSKLSSFPHEDASEGLETKTPPELGSGGVRNVEHSKWDQPISPPRERARMSPPRA